MFRGTCTLRPVHSAASGPSVLDWVSVVGQLMGTAGTVAAVVLALWVSRRDGRRLHAELADREAGQARLVTADVHRAAGRWWVRTTNHSTAPVFGVEVVEARHQGGPSHVEPLPGAPAVVEVLGTGESVDRALDVPTGSDPDPGRDVVVTRYLDAAGLRWRREGAGQPQRELG